jgi:hypothetical protein
MNWFKKEEISGIGAQEAERILRDVPIQNSFLVKNGMTLKNLYDLKEALHLMSEESFSHHVNAEKNDFVSWIKEIHKDEVLAKSLSKAKTKEEFASRLQSRILLLDLIRK